MSSVPGCIRTDIRGDGLVNLIWSGFRLWGSGLRIIAWDETGLIDSTKLYCIQACFSIINNPLSHISVFLLSRLNVCCLSWWIVLPYMVLSPFLTQENNVDHHIAAESHIWEI